MDYISKRITGIPYGKNKKRGDKNAPLEWTKKIKEQTKDIIKVKEPCRLKVKFFLPPNKFPKDLPYGSDLDNLLKRFFDALNETIFSKTQGKDSCVVEVNAVKIEVDSEEKAGVFLKVLPTKIKRK